MEKVSHSESGHEKLQKPEIGGKTIAVGEERVGRATARRLSLHGSHGLGGGEEIQYLVIILYPVQRDTRKEKTKHREPGRI